MARRKKKKGNGENAPSVSSGVDAVDGGRNPSQQTVNHHEENAIIAEKTHHSSGDAIRDSDRQQLRHSTRNDENETSHKADRLKAPIQQRHARQHSDNEMRGDVLALLIFIVLQALVSATDYSGHAKPPMFGDFEAQRHWMEISVNLPLADWYVNSTRNDLNYWGLDYPPLTAYHSWVLGKIAERLDPSWVALDDSRGLERADHKLFMRLSVIVTMLALYAPAFLAIHRVADLKPSPTASMQRALMLISTFAYPGIIFVDNGHFQYNHIALGLLLWAIRAFQTKRYLWGAALFSLALNFKQMTLYHALPIFVFLLAKSPTIGAGDNRKLVRRWRSYVWWKSTFLGVAKLTAVVIAVFGVLWSPFLLASVGGPNIALHVLRRLFPVERGLFEDYVANLWCALSPIVKVRELYSLATLLRASAMLVLVSVTPSLVVLFHCPTERNFRLTLVISALSFFLFSFQVHEKTILMVTVPALLLQKDMPWAIAWLQSISLFSLYPLCIKDGVPEILPLFVAYYFFINHIVAPKLASVKPECNKWTTIRKRAGVAFSAFSFCVCVAQLLVEAPTRYPHLYALVTAAFSFAHFAVFWAWANFQLVQWNYFISVSAVGSTSLTNDNTQQQQHTKGNKKRRNRRAREERT